MDTHRSHAHRNLIPERPVGLTQPVYDLGILSGNILTLRRVHLHIIEILPVLVHEAPTLCQYHRVGERLRGQGACTGPPMILDDMMLPRPRGLGPVQQWLQRDSIRFIPLRHRDTTQIGQGRQDINVRGQRINIPPPGQPATGPVNEEGHTVTTVVN